MCFLESLIQVAFYFGKRHCQCHTSKFEGENCNLLRFGLVFLLSEGDYEASAPYLFSVDFFRGCSEIFVILSGS